MMFTRSRPRGSAAAALLCAAVGLTTAASCSGPSNADPTPTSTMPTYNPATQASADAAQKKADIATAKKAYKQFVAMDPLKRADLPPEAKKIATENAIKRANKANRQIFTKGVTAKGGTRVVSMKVTEYERHPHWSIAMRVCTASTLTYYKDGKNITVDPDGKPIPAGKEVRSKNLVTFRVDPDGKTWKVATIQAEDGKC